jgi:hypothetical protein
MCAAFDGSSNLICATIEVVACMSGTNCTRGQARTFELPEFMTVDFKKKIIHVTYDGGSTEAESPPVSRFRPVMPAPFSAALLSPG